MHASCKEINKIFNDQVLSRSHDQSYCVLFVTGHWSWTGLTGSVGHVYTKSEKIFVSYRKYCGNYGWGQRIINSPTLIFLLWWPVMALLHCTLCWYYWDIIVYTALHTDHWPSKYNSQKYNCLGTKPNI